MYCQDIAADVRLAGEDYLPLIRPPSRNSVHLMIACGWGATQASPLSQPSAVLKVWASTRTAPEHRGALFRLLCWPFSACPTLLTTPSPVHSTMNPKPYKETVAQSASWKSQLKAVYSKRQNHECSDNYNPSNDLLPKLYYWNAVFSFYLFPFFYILKNSLEWHKCMYMHTHIHIYSYILESLSVKFIPKYFGFVIDICACVRSGVFITLQ